MLSPDELDEYLEVLQERKVSEFSCPEFSVSLLPIARSVEKEEGITDAIREGNEAARRPSPRGVFAHRSLWGDSGPPAFPGVVNK